MGVKKARFPSVIGPCVVGPYVVAPVVAGEVFRNVVQLVAVVVIVGVIEGLVLTFSKSRAYNRGNFTEDYSGMSNRITIEDYNDIEYIKNRIDSAIDCFCDDYNIQDLKNETQNVFNGLLRYIYNHVFKANNKLKHDDRSKTLIDINNIDIIIGVLEHYIYLCDIYSKAISIQGFSVLTGIDYSIIYDWKNGVHRRLNPKYADIYKTLDAERERSLADILLSGKKQPIGILAVLNHEKGWNLPGASKEVKHVVTAESPQQIAERYRARLADSAGNNDN